MDSLDSRRVQGPALFFIDSMMSHDAKSIARGRLAEKQQKTDCIDGTIELSIKYRCSTISFTSRGKQEQPLEEFFFRNVESACSKREQQE